MGEGNPPTAAAVSSQAWLHLQPNGAEAALEPLLHHPWVSWGQQQQQWLGEVVGEGEGRERVAKEGGEGRVEGKCLPA